MPVDHVLKEYKNKRLCKELIETKYALRNFKTSINKLIDRIDQEYFGNFQKPLSLFCAIIGVHKNFVVYFYRRIVEPIRE